MSHNDSNFYKPFVFVLGALVIFTLFILFVANSWSPDSPDDPLQVAATQKAIQPVGQSRVAEVVETAEPEASAAPAVSPTAEETEQTSEVEQTEEAPATESETETETETAEAAPAEEVPVAASDDNATATVSAAVASAGDASLKVKATVATNCAGCHNIGLDGAAKSDDAAAWTALSEKGIDELTASVINGKGKMPARAESSLSDEEIAQAVQLMIANATGSELTAGTAAATSAAVATAATAGDSSAAESTEPQAETTEVADSSASAPAPVPAEVMQVADSVCAACHIAGVANAPKYGDKAAWQARLDAKGIDGLTASAIAGIGAMPARGGSALNDEQMKLAIEYMISK